jgi:Protein of unknown function (DUF3551)
MRIASLTMMAALTLLGIGGARAQVLDPRFAACLHNYGPVEYYDCSYSSLAQCNASAPGRSADCLLNPYFARTSQDRLQGRYRQPQRAY